MPTEWPQRIPPDLSRRIERALSMRSHGPMEVWGELREWLIEYQVACPEQLPQWETFEGSRDGAWGMPTDEW